MESILATCKISQPCPFQGSEGRAYVVHYGLSDRKIRTFNFKSFADYLHSTHFELAKQFRHFGINFRRFIVFDLQFSANISKISLSAKLFPSLFKNKIAKVLFVGSFKWQCQCIFLWHCESWTGHLQKALLG